MTRPTPPAPPASPAPTPAAPVPTSSALAHLMRWAVGGLIILVVIVAGYFGVVWWTQRLETSITDDAFVEAHIVNVGPQSVSGHIVRYLVEENDRVVQGQVMAEIDPIPYRDRVDVAQSKVEVAEAELRRQEAGLARLKLEVPLQIEIAQRTLAAAKAEQAKADEALKLTSDEVEKTIDESQAGVNAAKASEVLGKQEYDRYKELYQQEAVALRRYQEVIKANDTAQAEVKLADAKKGKALAARTRIDVAKRDVEVARTMTEKAAKAVELAETGYAAIKETELLTAVKKEMVVEAKTALESAKNDLKFTRIRAPFPGVVVKRYRNLGDFASAGASILSMYNPDLMYVTANLPETRLRGVAPGNPVELQLNAFAEPFHGRVVWINKSTGAQFSLMPRNVVSGEFTWVEQRVPVRIAIEKDDRWPLLQAGLSVRAVIGHGVGDPQWAEQAAREMADLEARYNRAKE
jgi:membrane fusion protein, multidrug efflux system